MSGVDHRDEGPDPRVLGFRRRQQRRSQGAGRLDLRDHRPQRCRQDDLLQSPDQVPAADARPHQVSREQTSPIMEPADVARLGVGRSFQISAVFLGADRAAECAHGPAARARRVIRFLALRNVRSTHTTNGRDELLARRRARGLGRHARRLAVHTGASARWRSRRRWRLIRSCCCSTSHRRHGARGCRADRRARSSRSARGRTVLMVEHNLSVVEGLCDYVIVMTRGSILAEGSYASDLAQIPT